MKLLVFLLMHSVGKPDFLYHMQGYGNHTMSTARKSQCFTDMELRNWNFLDHLFLAWSRNAEMCIHKFSDFRPFHITYLYAHLSVAQLCPGLSDCPSCKS